MFLFYKNNIYQLPIEGDMWIKYLRLFWFDDQWK